MKMQAKHYHSIKLLQAKSLNAYVCVCGNVATNNRWSFVIVFLNADGVSACRFLCVSYENVSLDVGFCSNKVKQ